jgi:hypothetical protein
MSEEKGKEEENKESAETGSKAVESNAKIAALAMKGASPPQKIIVYCCYGVILLGIVALTVPPYQAAKELVALIFTIGCLVTVAIFVPARYRDLSSISQGAPPQPPLPHPWSQPLPISDLKLKYLRTTLGATREAALQFLNESLKSRDQIIPDELVRANIFFPEYDSPSNPQRYKLKICPGLHLMMQDSSPELHISFLPNQGATGHVFASGQACVAQRLGSGEGDWNDIYNITDELAEIIHPDLKWVISMPLQLPGAKPMGVVNVDGLQYEFPTDTLYDCMLKLTTNVVVMSSVLAAQ